MSQPMSQSMSSNPSRGMPQQEVYPLIFEPVFKDYPWGGRNLAEKLGRSLPDGIVAESWEIAAHPNGQSRVANGAAAGKTLGELVDAWGADLLGRHSSQALEQGRFPLLIKLLDANRWLSVQVHPDDSYAAQHAADLGKTEMWVVLHAEPDAELIYGFRPGVDRDKFAAAIAAGETERWLHRMRVQAGDVIFVPTGAIHALGPGIIVAEIQQNSDTTYRIYDWGRDRPLHIEHALNVLNFDLIEPDIVTPQPVASRGVATELIGRCDYFRTERLALSEQAQVHGNCDGDTFEVWGVLDGRIRVEWNGEPLEIDAVGWVLLPAVLGPYTISAEAGATLLRVVTPEPARP